MANGISATSLSIVFNRYISKSKLSNNLFLPLDRKAGDLVRLTYVYADALPLPMEVKSKYQPKPHQLSLSISVPLGTIEPSLYVISSALPLLMGRLVVNHPTPNSIPLSLSRKLQTKKDIPVNFKPEAKLLALEGFISSGFDQPAIRNASISLNVVGISSPASSNQHGITQLPKEGYVVSTGLKFPLLDRISDRPSESELQLPIYRKLTQFIKRPDIVISTNRYLYPDSFLSSVVSKQFTIDLYWQYVSSIGFDSSSIGSPAIKNAIDYIDVKSFGLSVIGDSHSIVNKNKRITTIGWDSQKLGNGSLYNLLQRRWLSGFDSSAYGDAYLIGGVKWLRPSGVSSNVYGIASLFNPMANRTIELNGIAPAGVPAPNVSPRILYPSGIFNNGVYANGYNGVYETVKIGKPDIRDPAVKPLGEQHDSYGTPTIWYHTRPLAPNGILSYESGYPRVADPTQFIDPPSLLTSAIFGDTATRNLSFRVSVPSLDGSMFSDYTTFTNSNRYYATKGIDSLAIGAASIVNKTPSIFVDGITHYDIGTPAIGHAIRFVQPTGFDRLLLGRPVLIKAPELLVKGHEDSDFTKPTVWYKNRTINLNARGINSFVAGTNNTLWYKLRPFKPQGWQSSRHSLPQLTHGVRTVEPQGFRRDVFGSLAWVSQGTRVVAPIAIYEPKNSSHMVGGTQTIKPAGYEATLWGERIVPVDTKVFPIGFAGAFGLTEVGLYIRYLSPLGYITVGQQPADRWGDSVAYNKTQYITQEFDVNSGLVPPKMEGWTGIENRNRTIGVTSFIATKFGYSQIDNNATPLLPEAIKPPPITIGMISHGIRTIAPEAIEAPLMSTWGVVYNGARVIAPLGNAHTQQGNDGTVVNTRREYRNVGRIDSLETGKPMIAYRIRTIDIEPRYSIAPPQINLPTIHLYNSYVTFRGYETAKYGTPFVEEHFSIIYPKWTHKEKFGEGVVYNNTPEYAAYGHDSSEFGDTAIRTEWRNLYAQGSDTSLFGAVDIADTKREIKIAGWIDSRSSQQHKVIKMGTNPYTTQNIWLNNESNPSAEGYGMPPPTRQVSDAGINQNVLYPTGINSQKFGTAFTWSNNIYIDTGIPIQSMDAGPVVSNKKRFLSPAGIDNEIEVSGLARVTPSYLRQYHDYSQAAGEVFGWQTVTNQHRTIYPHGHQSSEVGRYGAYATVELSTRYVQPKAIRQFLFGVPELPFTPKDVVTYGALSEVFGLTAVKHPPYTGPQTVVAKGLNSLSFGTTAVELFNRYLGAIGHNSQAMGRYITGDTPYMWQGLRIGEFIPMSISGGDTSLFGEARISLKVQPIDLEGFVAFRSEYDYTNFNARMKVTGTITDYVTEQNITASGIDSETMGNPSIKPAQHFIRPDGNSDQFRKGAF